MMDCKSMAIPMTMNLKKLGSDVVVQISLIPHCINSWLVH